MEGTIKLKLSHPTEGTKLKNPTFGNKGNPPRPISTEVNFLETSQA